MRRFLALLVLLVSALALLGCDVLRDESQSPRTALPPASQIIREADRQGIDPYDLLERYYQVKRDEIEDYYSRRIERARSDSDRRREELFRDREYDLLDVTKTDVQEDLDRRLERGINLP